jgi:hypothetical protein
MNKNKKKYNSVSTGGIKIFFEKIVSYSSKRGMNPCFLVRMEGLEPSRPKPYASETYAYTSSATSASLLKARI